MSIKSYYPFNHKLRAIRILYNSCGNIVTEVVNAEKETEHVNQACEPSVGYPAWSFEKVRLQLHPRDAYPKRHRNDTNEDTKTKASVPDLPQSTI